MRMRLAKAIAGLAAFAAMLYVFVFRPRHLHWGATKEEVKNSLPGDDLVKHPFLTSTRAITIHTPAEKVWPWLLQMGYRRGGWYSYDWIDNKRAPSATRVIPELQYLKPGDILQTDAKHGFTVAKIKPNHHLVLHIDDRAAHISSALVLDEVEPDKTRMIVRLRARFRPTLRGLLSYLIFEPGDFVMMRKMMRGIKDRAEEIVLPEDETA